MKKRIYTALVSAALMLAAFTALAACGSAAEEPETADISSQKVDGMEAVLSEEQRMAFGEVLWNAYLTGTLPDGGVLDHVSLEAAAGNSFALTDIDGDGQAELMLAWTNAAMAGMVEYVFGCDGDAVHVELAAFPSLRFYDNGAVEADWSHNQGLAGEFWPYFAYLYDEENDVYRSIGGVDAWDRSVREKNENGDDFPTKLDADGDGVVYYLLPADWDGHYDESMFADGPAFESWRAGYLDGAQEIEIFWRELTEENIEEFGCPKPDVEMPEPAG